MAWYVVRCKIKGEHKAERELRLAGFEAYLPEYKIERLNRRLRKKVISTLCLFPRYLFVRVDEAGQLGYVLGTAGVDDVLPGRPHEPQPVPAHDVIGLRDAQAALKLDDTDEARRRRGQTTKSSLAALRKRLRNKRVRVTDGPFSSFPGTVERVESLERLRVIIDIFGRETPVELELGQIEELAQRREAA